LVARPDLVAGPVFKTGGAYGDVGSASSILVRYRHKNLMVGWMVCRRGIAALELLAYDSITLL
jgi:hypothetical protein